MQRITNNDTEDGTMKTTEAFGSLADGIAHAKIHGGRVATHHNTHEVTWFSVAWLPMDIMGEAESMSIATFGTWSSFNA